VLIKKGGGSDLIEKNDISEEFIIFPQFNFLEKATRSSSNKKNILIATNMSGLNSGTGHRITNAIRLFMKFNNPKRWQLTLYDTKSKEKFNADLTYQLYQHAKPDSIIFAPRGTKASLNFIDSYSSRNNIKDNVVFLNQITATSLFNEHFPTLSTFLAAQDYLEGIIGIMKRELGYPEKVFR